VGLLYLAPRIVATTRSLLTKFRGLLCAPGGGGGTPSTVGGYSLTLG
jgi:hypothetical protein